MPLLFAFMVYVSQICEILDTSTKLQCWNASVYYSYICNNVNYIVHSGIHFILQLLFVVTFLQ